MRSVLFVVLIASAFLFHGLSAQEEPDLEDIFPGECTDLLYKYATEVECMDSFATMIALLKQMPSTSPKTICEGPCRAKVEEVLDCTASHYDEMEEEYRVQMETFRRLLCSQDSANNYCLLHSFELIALTPATLPTTNAGFQAVCKECYYKVSNALSQVVGRFPTLKKSAELSESVQNLASVCSKIFIPGDLFCLEIYPPTSPPPAFEQVLANLNNICSNSCLNKLYATQLLNTSLSAYDVAVKETTMSTLCMKYYTPDPDQYCALLYGALFATGGILQQCGAGAQMGCYDPNCSEFLNYWYSTIGCCYYPMSSMFGSANPSTNIYPLLATCPFSNDLFSRPSCSIYDATGTMNTGLTVTLDVPETYMKDSFGQEYFMRDIALNFGILPSQIVIDATAKSGTDMMQTTVTFSVRTRDAATQLDFTLQRGNLLPKGLIFPHTYSHYTEKVATSSASHATISLFALFLAALSLFIIA
eukprot:TRINITY_DN1458_c0_g3_i2.p1 TRINITY_DN1458_c0_g3~~TRINITY_DN1458_c0_g3_i2.p1  ORF type:complete len:475 (-),score=103.89 TRINITY_DN1458_c0_g3_i2:521-1945(-)